MANYTLTTPPTTEPISLADVRIHLRIDTHEEDAYITELVEAARNYVERYLDRSLITQTWTATFDTFFDDNLILRHGVVASVTSVTYLDNDGVQQTLSTDVYELARENGRQLIRLKFNQTWPAHRVHMDNITVVYVTGYGVASDVPTAIQHAMLMLIGHWYENREAVLVGSIQTEYDLAVESLLSTYRYIEVG